MTITYRDQLNRDLTPAEVDANFRHVLDSANSTFLPSGIGAVATDLQTKDRQIISVWDFMSAAQKADVIAGTLLVDIAPAFTLAFASYGSGAGYVAVPGGIGFNYKLSSAIRITKSWQGLIVLPGAKLTVGAGVNGIEVDGGAGGIQQVCVLCYGEIVGGASSQHGFYTKNVGKSTFYFADIRNMAGNGIDIDEGFVSNRLTYRRINGCTGWGIKGHPVSGNGIVANIFEGETQANVLGGITGQFMHDNEFHGVSEANTGPGMVLDMCLGNNIKTYFEANTGSDLVFDVTGASECAFNVVDSPTSFHTAGAGATYNIDIKSTAHDITIGRIFTTNTGQILRLAVGTTNTKLRGARIAAGSITNNTTSAVQIELDYYDGGGIAFTPTLAGSGTAGTQTYAMQAAKYTRVGSRVHFQGRITLSALDGATAGNMQIKGLPFVAASGNAMSAITFGAWGQVTLTAGFTQLSGIITAGNAFIDLYQSGSTKALTTLAVAGVAATTDLIFEGSYEV